MSGPNENFMWALVGFCLTVSAVAAVVVVVAWVLVAADGWRLWRNRRRWRRG